MSKTNEYNGYEPTSTSKNYRKNNEIKMNRLHKYNKSVTRSNKDRDGNSQ